MTLTATDGKRDPATEAAGAARARWFVVRFLLSLVVFYTLYALTKNGPAFEAHRTFLAWITAGLLALPYGEIERVGTTLLHPGQDGVDVGEGCDAIYPILCFVGGVIAFAASRRAKVTGVLLGLLAIEVMNVVRIGSLFLIQRHDPEHFHLWHTTIWEAIFVLLAVLLWALWAAKVVQRPGSG